MDAVQHKFSENSVISLHDFKTSWVGLFNNFTFYVLLKVVHSFVYGQVNNIILGILNDTVSATDVYI